MVIKRSPLPCLVQAIPKHIIHTHTHLNHIGFLREVKTEPQLLTVVINLRIHTYVGFPSMEDVVAAPSPSAFLGQHTRTPAT